MPTTAIDLDLEASFQAFVDTRSRALARTAYLLTGDHHLAEDLLQTALFKAARNWHRIHGHHEAYVRRILANENISWWRRRKLTETPLEIYDAAAPTGDNDLRLTLADALGRLTARQRTILVLRFYEDLTEVQTAETLGISVGAVKSMTRQALGRLRTLAPELAELVGEVS